MNGQAHMDVQSGRQRKEEKIEIEPMWWLLAALGDEGCK
jgi:hypothetical protein